MKTIEISDSLYTELEKLATFTYNTPESVIWNLINSSRKENKKIIEESYQESSKENISINGFLNCRGGSIPIGLKIKADYKNETIYGEVKSEGIQINNKIYRTPSEAAVGIVEERGKEFYRPHINGWIFWEYMGKDNRWHKLDDIRNKVEVEPDCPKDEVNVIIEELVKYDEDFVKRLGENIRDDFKEYAWKYLSRKVYVQLSRWCWPKRDSNREKYVKPKARDLSKQLFGCVITRLKDPSYQS